MIIVNKKQKNKEKQNKRRKRNQKKKNSKNTKKELFSYQPFFPSFGGCPKFPFFDTLAQKVCTQKHYRNRGFSNFFLKSRCASGNGHFWKKKNSSCHFCLFLLFQQQKHKNLLKPQFYSVSANLKKRIFKNELKTEKFEKPNFCTLFSKKAIFRKLANNWTQKNIKW